MTIFKRGLMALALFGAGAVAFSAGSMTAEQILLVDAQSGASISAAAFVRQIAHWGDLLPFARLDGQGKKECTGYDVVTGKEIGPWKPEADGRCRLRDFITHEFVRELGAHVATEDH